MNEKYFYIDKQVACQLLQEIEHMQYEKRGIDRCAYLLGDYAVLSTSRLKLRNVDTRDDELIYLDEIIETLADMRTHGIMVVPILGYCYDSDSADGEGYMIQQRAKGAELFDDAIMTRFSVWAHNQPHTYLSTNTNIEEAADYLCTRTHTISLVSQKHFDHFISDMINILKKDILIDYNGQSNFFYDSNVGFQFIDLDAHNDYRYGLSAEKPCVEKIVACCGFVPCHYAEGTSLFAHVALANDALDVIECEKLQNLKMDNQMIFEKCRLAMRNNGIPESVLNQAMRKLKVYGC